mmetsp:Transcript_4796/g.16004  ORF Transcript_4796/g.16004 Transcript_4796/m.16004 type:complete len:275 (-) Transcript_4796:17-841(-)
MCSCAARISFAATSRGSRSASRFSRASFVAADSSSPTADASLESSLTCKDAIDARAKRSASSFAAFMSSSSAQSEAFGTKSHPGCFSNRFARLACVLNAAGSVLKCSTPWFLCSKSYANAISLTSTLDNAAASPVFIANAFTACTDASLGAHVVSVPSARASASRPFLSRISSITSSIVTHIASKCSSLNPLMIALASMTALRTSGSRSCALLDASAAAASTFAPTAGGSGSSRTILDHGEDWVDVDWVDNDDDAMVCARGRGVCDAARWRARE